MATSTNTMSPTADEKAISLEAGSSVNGGGHHHHHHDYNLNNSNNNGNGLVQADGGSLHPGMWKPYEHRKFANPAPLGLSAFALTTFVLSCVNMHARDVAAPNIVVPLAFGYGGLVQLCAGMW